MKVAMIGAFLIIGGLASIGFVTIFALSHPTLTQSQIFLKFWWLLILGSGIVSIGVMLVKRYTDA